MRQREDVQVVFAAAIRDASMPPPPSVAVRRGELVRRFAVYRNNVFVSLVEALAVAFPVTRRLVGEEFFRAMARVYAADCLPQSPVLLDYGESFPDFVATFEPASSVPYLADVARLEWAWSRAYHAAEAAPLAPEALAALDPENLAAIRFRLHPATRWLHSPQPVVTIWRANQAAGVPRLVLPPEGEDVLVTRPHFMVEVAVVPGGTLALLTAVAEGRDLADAVEAAAQAAPGFDLARVLALLLANGAFAALL